MFQVLFLLTLFVSSGDSSVICEEQTSYEQVCYTFDYTSPKCGPSLQTCPVVDVSYDKMCSVYVCMVNLTKILQS